MRVNLHMKASAEARKVRTQKIADDDGEGLICQFLKSEEEKAVQAVEHQDPASVRVRLSEARTLGASSRA